MAPSKCSGNVNGYCLPPFSSPYQSGPPSLPEPLSLSSSPPLHPHQYPQEDKETTSPRWTFFWSQQTKSGRTNPFFFWPIPSSLPGALHPSSLHLPPPHPSGPSLAISFMSPPPFISQCFVFPSSQNFSDYIITACFLSGSPWGFEFL